MSELAHMCRDGHTEIRHSDSEHEMCPLCRALGELDNARERIAEAETLTTSWREKAEHLQRHYNLLESQRESMRKLSGELVGFIEAHELAHSHEIARRAILESAQKAGIANPSSSEPHGGPPRADATSPRH